MNVLERLSDRLQPPVNHDQPVAIVFGTNVGACRALRAAGVPVVMINATAPEHPYPGLEFHRCPSYGLRHTEESWLPEMLSYAKRYARAGRPVLFPATDIGLLTCAQHRAALDEAFAVTCSAPDIVRKLINKTEFSEWAQANDIPIPKSWVVRKADELWAAANEVGLPCIVKPEFTFLLEDLESTKLFYAHTRDEIVRFGTRILEHGLTVVLQADVSAGGSSTQWSLAGVCDPPGQIRQAMLSRKLRQVRWGAGTAMETMPMDDQILGLGRDFCRKLGLSGIFELELRPGLDQQPVIIEMNARIWTQVRLPAAAGINLVLSAYHCAIGSPVPETMSYRSGVGWIRWRHDFLVGLAMLKRREISATDFVTSLTHVRVFD